MSLFSHIASEQVVSRSEWIQAFFAFLHLVLQIITFMGQLIGFGMALTRRHTVTFIFLLNKLHERVRYRKPTQNYCSISLPPRSRILIAVSRSWYELTKSSLKAIRRYSDVIKVTNEFYLRQVEDQLANREEEKEPHGSPPHDHGR